MVDRETLTYQTINQFIRSHISFSLEDVARAVKSKGGAMILAPSYKVADYLNNLVENEELTYDPVARKYKRVSQTLSLR